ncbi:MAG TPA: AAA family ATPase [Longimicrobiales bacterium]
MADTDPLKDLELLIRSRYCVVHVDTAEEERAAGLVSHVADRLGLPLFEWSRTKGLRRTDKDGAIFKTQEPAGALAHIAAARFPAVYHFRGLGPHLQDPDVAALLRDAAAPFAEVGGAIVLTGADVTLPDAVGPMSARVELAPPPLEEYRRLLTRVLRDVHARTPVRVEMTPRDTTRLLNAIKGLTLMEAEKLLTRAIIEDGRLTPDDLHVVVEAKREIVEREGLLEYYPAEETMADIAGLEGLKQWLAQRRAIIAEPERAAAYGLSFPKGVLLVGVPGCGKSLCAKAVAMEWALPLLKLDPANLYNKYIGESEKNFKRAVETAERMAPVVLWIDEIEKAFATAGDGDGGVSQRVLGTFLSWLQDRNGDVFVVATANDVSRLPPEFLRKGRFDEIFFVDLPDEAARRALFAIHLKRRGQAPARFDVDVLARATDGFSGAEVEQVVVSGLYTAFAASQPLTTATLLEEAARTQPLSRTMAEKIAALRAWARERTVAAG